MIDALPDPDDEQVSPDDESSGAAAAGAAGDAASDDPLAAAFADAFGSGDGAADENAGDVWPAEDLESAYRRALEANDSVEWDFSHYAAEASEETDASAPSDGDTADADGHATDSETAGDGAAGAAEPSAAESRTSEPKSSAVPPPRIRMAQVVEAALFVGGEPLTSKRLCYMLKGDYDLDAIEAAIDELNHRYDEEGRPYEIRLGEGGYRIVLRDEFNAVRNRVFGIGPREVKLSQEVLEVLALVAYRQPVTQQEIEDLGKDSPGTALRQLLRRQLIELHRDEENRKRVTYSTTPRFLSVFGIGSIKELPQADELAFK